MRKQPAQQRSRQMVDALLDAAEREIGTRGLDATTTNHVAARAGVSIGSLYQYFAGKDAIVEALLQRHAQRLLAAVDARLRTLLDADPHTVTQRVLEAVFEQVERDPAQRELVRHWHRLRTGATFQALEQRMFEHCRLYLLRHHDEYRVPNLPAALFVAINSLHYTVAHYLSLDAPLLSRDEVIDALADLLAAYLRGAAPAKPAARRRTPAARVKAAGSARKARKS
ncbi:TetR/AcrR family transcriptional regulator [Solimonas variicoloris]|uniref:TetR/AcrR family transcriptional regulator n=1 Tax=Solimonas variicoloris TaxID=254408 RepID=UPI00146E6748|nr:TetR/AcrR family transcriptional regulator [Solimonas variicoloris]